MMMMHNVGDDQSSEIAFFDLETVVVEDRGHRGRSSPIIEIAAIVVSQRTLVEVLRPFSALVRPTDPYLISCLGPGRSNGITQDAVSAAPTFEEISDDVYLILHGRIWAGHNIEQHDCPLLEKAFLEIGRRPPEPTVIIDSLPLLEQTFGTRAGDMRLNSLAAYFGLGEQTHRSLADVRLNLEVLRRCATVLFLESNPPENKQFLKPDEVRIESISARQEGHRKLKLLHGSKPLQLFCPRLRVRYGINLNFRFEDAAGWPKLDIVVDSSPGLCRVLNACDSVAKTLSMDLGSTSEWKDVVAARDGEPTLKLNIPTHDNGDGTAQHETQIHLEDPNSRSTEKLEFDFDPQGLRDFLRPGTQVDAYLSLHPYDYRNHSGIRLVAKRLIVRN